MRAEVEIREALRRLGGQENEQPQVTNEGILLPLNGIACDVLRWVVGEESDFGEALAIAEASEHARLN